MASPGVKPARKYAKRKRGVHEVSHGTEMRDIQGITPDVLQDLALGGYRVKSRTTYGEFRAMTKSYDNIEKQFRSMEMDAGYSLNKLKSLWDHAPIGAGESKRSKPDDTSADRALDSNFLLTNHGEQPEEERKHKETPEADALDRHPDPTKAVPLGAIQGGPALSVIPDVTLNVSPDDKGINAPTEVLPDQPTPLIPAIALGPAVVGSRYVAPQTLEEKQQAQGLEKELPSTKADGQKDIGGDGFGALTTEAKVGKDDPLRGDEGRPKVQSGQGTRTNSRFTAVPLQRNNEPKAADKQEVKPMDWRTASRHPFKQASLFANHDQQMKLSKLLEEHCYERYTTNAADNLIQDIERNDASWYKYNPATQGVTAPYMNPLSGNYLQRGAMTTDLQMTGPAPMYNQFGPCPMVWEKMSGRFR